MWNLLPQPEYVVCFYRRSLNNAWGSFYPLSISCPETCMFVRSHSRQLCDMPNKRRVSLYNKAGDLDMFHAYNQTSWPTILVPGADARWEVTNSRGSEGSMIMDPWIRYGWVWMDPGHRNKRIRDMLKSFSQTALMSFEIILYKKTITRRHWVLDNNWQVKLNIPSNGNGYQVPLCLGIKWIDKILDGAIKTLPRDNYHREMCDNEDIN